MSRAGKIFKKSEKTTVHFFPECEKVNTYKIEKVEYSDGAEYSRILEHLESML